MGRYQLRLVGISGILFVALLIASSVIVPPPVDVDKPITEITGYFNDHHNAWIASTVLAMVVLPFFLIFISGLRSLLAKAEGERAVLANAGYAAGIALATVAALIQPVVASVLVQRLATSGNEPVIRAVYELSQLLYSPLSIASAAFLLAASLVILMTGVLPRWLGALGLLAAALSELGGLALLLKDTSPVGVFGFIGFLAFALWVLIISIVLLVRDRRSVAT